MFIVLGRTYFHKRFYLNPKNPKAAPLNSPKGGNTKTQKYLRFSFFALLKHIFQNNT
jgi:hypothetical protein